MEFGVQLGNLEPAQYRAHAQTAETLGYDLIVFPDHLVNEGPDKQMDPKSKAYDHIVMAAAVIDATKKIRVGHLVLCNLFRHPAITAQSLMTLDHLSGGRLVAGLGSGWTETEFKMSGIPFPPITERLRMLDEAMACILSLWKNEKTTFDGEFYHFKDAILWPKPLQQPHPPIIVGGGGKGLLRIAAKYADYVNVIPDAGKRGYISMEVARKMTNDSFREKVNFIRDEAKRVGRKPDAVRISNFRFHDDDLRIEGSIAQDRRDDGADVPADGRRETRLAVDADRNARGMHRRAEAARERLGHLADHIYRRSRPERKADARSARESAEARVAMSLESKVVVVLGGSTGMGFATAKAAAAEGAQVVITGRSPEKLRGSASTTS